MNTKFWQAFEDASGSKSVKVLNDTVCLNNTWIYLNMPSCSSICMKMGEYCRMSWICVKMPDSDYARVFNIPHHLRHLTGFWIYFNKVMTLLGRAIWDKLPKCIFENFQIARVKWIIIIKANKVLTHFSFWIQWRQDFGSI